MPLINRSIARAELNMLLDDPSFGPASHYDENNPPPLRIVELYIQP
jgi:pyruvate decarboxylase